MTKDGEIQNLALGTAYQTDDTSGLFKVIISNIYIHVIFVIIVDLICIWRERKRKGRGGVSMIWQQIYKNILTTQFVFPTIHVCLSFSFPSYHMFALSKNVITK
jgi:hypothetical protein